MGRTGDGGYAVIIGGVVDRQGKLENHGRWLPYPMLVPMMVGTAMSLEKDYYSSDAAYEIGQLSQQMLLGTWKSKERIRTFYWAAHQLARKMNFMQMAELTQSCPDLQAVFDLAALIRMRNGPLAEAVGKIKSAKRKALFPSAGEAPPLVDLQELEHNKTIAEKKIRGGFKDHLCRYLALGRFLLRPQVRGELPGIRQRRGQNRCRGRSR